MKRRFTLVTAEEPLPQSDDDDAGDGNENDDDIKEQPQILKNEQQILSQAPPDNEDGTGRIASLFLLFHYILSIHSSSNFNCFLSIFFSPFFVLKRN